jgi:hypothetical protein
MDGVNTLQEQFNACGLTLEMLSDITTMSWPPCSWTCTEAGTIDAWIPRVFHRTFQVFACIAGTRNDVGLESGKLRYLSAQLAKSSPAYA